MESKYVFNSYLTCLIHPYVSSCNREFPAINIYVTGSSGSFISAWLLAGIDLPDNVKVEVIYLKKDGENTHYDQKDRITISRNDDFNIIVDDFICTGETIQRILDDISEKGIHTVDLLLVSGGVDPDQIPVDRFGKIICCKIVELHKNTIVQIQS